MIQKINVGLIGFGHVGQGVANILKENKASLEQRIGAYLYISKIVVRSPEKYADINLNGATLSSDINDILEDDNIDIVVEVIGGEQPAYDYISKSLKQKKYVVTANKEVVAKHKNHFFKLAKENDVDLYFEASVGGGIPIIRSFKVGYSANQIQTISGILNGTTNYILTKMQEENLAFDDVLKQAQDLGFAEADPSMDVSGLDAAYKLAILAAVAFKQDIQIDDLYYEGIESISQKDVEYANELGYSIKLLALGTRNINSDSMTYKVHPTLIPVTHPLASVRNEFNAIFSLGNAMGDTMIYGKGAGSLPTGSAVVSDLCDIAFDLCLKKGSGRRNLESSLKKVSVLDIKATVSAFYSRISVKDEVGVLEQISHVLGEHQISIKKIIQKEAQNGVSELLIVTHNIIESRFDQALIGINKLDACKRIESTIRVGLGPDNQNTISAS